MIKYEPPILEQTIPQEELVLLKIVAQKRLNHHKSSFSVPDLVSEYAETPYYTKMFIDRITNRIKRLRSYCSTDEELIYFVSLPLEEKKALLLAQQKELFTLQHLILLIKTTTNWMKPSPPSILEGI